MYTPLQYEVLKAITDLCTRSYRSIVDLIHTLGMMLHAKNGGMPTELSLEGFVEKIILMRKKMIPGRRNSKCKGTVKGNNCYRGN